MGYLVHQLVLSVFCAYRFLSLLVTHSSEIIAGHFKLISSREIKNVRMRFISILWENVSTFPPHYMLDFTFFLFFGVFCSWLTTKPTSGGGRSGRSWPDWKKVQRTRMTFPSGTIPFTFLIFRRQDSVDVDLSMSDMNLRYSSALILIFFLTTRL